MGMRTGELVEEECGPWQDGPMAAVPSPYLEKGARMAALEASLPAQDLVSYIGTTHGKSSQKTCQCSTEKKST